MSDQQRKGRGGARPGAGRPRLGAEALQNWVVRLPPETIREIRERGLRARIRELILREVERRE